MIQNRSPWIHQLDKDRPVELLKSDIETDIAIIGGGIAGVSTAFFALRDTDKKVVLLEGGRLGHGATGHNAGQITSYFARSLHDLVTEFDVSQVVQAQKQVEEDAWELLDAIYTECRLDIPLARFKGHLGISQKEHLISVLKDNVIRRDNGLEPKEILIADGVDFLAEIEKSFAGLYGLASQSEILERLESRSTGFIACLSEQKGCMNSALFTEEVAMHLLGAYPDRFTIYEHAHINKVALHDDCAILDADTHTVRAGRVVLATNGFDTVDIYNKSGLDIDTRFHESIEGVIGYMSGYLEETVRAPIAISYFIDKGVLSGDSSSGDPYIYMTRRQYEYNSGKHCLISIGGPDASLENRKEYEKDHEYPEWARDEIDKFVKTYYDKSGEKEIDYIFTWHGLMGYTPKRLRIVGPEPKNPVLLYNLGCNGVGILPSIYGGKRISRFLNGEAVEPSIFDPYDQSLAKKAREPVA